MSKAQTAAETPAERTMRRWYEAKLAERLAQVAHMAKSRSLLRRGARKMQDGTLGQPGGTAEDEPVYIRIGDEFHPPAEAAKPSLLKTVGVPLLAAALGAGGVASVPWFASLLSPEPGRSQQAQPDHVQDIEIGGGEPTLNW